MKIEFKTTHHGKRRRCDTDMWSGFEDDQHNNLGRDGFCSHCAEWVGMPELRIKVGDALQATHWFDHKIEPADVDRLIRSLQRAGVAVITTEQLKETAS